MWGWSGRVAVGGAVVVVAVVVVGVEARDGW